MQSSDEGLLRAMIAVNRRSLSLRFAKVSSMEGDMTVDFAGVLLSGIWEAMCELERP